MILGWPYKHKRVGVASDGKFGRLGPFDYYWSNGKKIKLPHTGSDYRIGCNVPNYSPLDGRVYEVVNGTTGYGKYVRIALKNGYKVAFAHLNRIDVKKGEIKEGQRIGLVGNTGTGTGCHSHLELRNPSNRLVNPETIIKWRVLKESRVYLTKNQKTKICRDLLGRNCSPVAYKAKLTREDLLSRAYKEVSSNYIKLDRLRGDLKTLKDKIANDYISKTIYHKALEKADKQHSKVVSNLQGEYTVVWEKLKKCNTTKGGGVVGILDGKKTYIVGLGIILMAIGGFLSGDLTLAQAITSGLVGFGFGAVRHGISQK